MSRQVGRVDTLFLHETDGRFTVVVQRDGDRVFRGVLELKATDAGPRPGKFRVKRGSDDEPRDPDQFVELARRAERIRISEQTPPEGRRRIEALLDGYQLEALTVRTCRYCASAGRYSPITDDTAIRTNDEYICPDCAIRELERELSFKGNLTAAAQDRLEELLLDVQDLDRITNLLEGNLDPDLTKFDTISATTDEIDPVPTAGLDLHPDLQALIEDRFETLLPVQSLSVDNGLFDGRDQLVVSATATGKTLVGELAGLNRVLNGEGKLLFLVPLVALANQKHEDFADRYGHLVDVTLRVGASRINGSGSRFDPNADVVVGTYEGIDHALRTGRDLGDVGTVVIDEVHTLKEGERGHRLDGMISRLKHYCEERSRRRDGDGRQPRVARRTAPGDAHRVRRATRSHRAPRHLRERPGEARHREPTRQAGVRPRVQQGLPRADDNLHQLPAALSRDFPQTGVLVGTVPRRTRLQAPQEGRADVRRPGPRGRRHHGRTGRGRGLPRLAGDI